MTSGLEIDPDRGYAMANMLASLGAQVGDNVLDQALNAVISGMPGSQMARIIPSMSACAEDANKSMPQRLNRVNELVNSAVASFVDEDDTNAGELETVGGGPR